MIAVISSGANLVVALKGAEALGPGRRVVTVVPDTGPYTSKEDCIASRANRPATEREGTGQHRTTGTAVETALTWTGRHETAPDGQRNTGVVILIIRRPVVRVHPAPREDQVKG